MMKSLQYYQDVSVGWIVGSFLHESGTDPEIWPAGKCGCP
jgi:hypothetical protein